MPQRPVKLDRHPAKQIDGAPSIVALERNRDDPAQVSHEAAHLREGGAVEPLQKLLRVLRRPETLFEWRRSFGRDALRPILLYDDDRIKLGGEAITCREVQMMG